MYACEIRDEYGDVESATTQHTPHECMLWFDQHGVNFYQTNMKTLTHPNLIASYSYARPTPTKTEGTK